MPSELIAALLGASVAFAGTYMLQRGQFRRADLDGLRERLGLARALRADLHVAKLACELSIQNKLIPPGTRFPVNLWMSDGHRLIGAIHASAESAMVDAFGRINLVNGLLATMPLSSGLSLTDQEGEADGQIAVDSLQQLITKIDLAVVCLDKLESEYEKHEQRLRHPARARLHLDPK